MHLLIPGWGVMGKTQAAGTMQTMVHPCVCTQLRQTICSAYKVCKGAQCVQSTHSVYQNSKFTANLSANYKLLKVSQKVPLVTPHNMDQSQLKPSG